MELDVLAIGTHPDDVELFCGGTLIKLAESGFQTGVVDLTLGELSTRGDPATRAGETRKATEILKLKYRDNLKLPDGSLTNTEKHRKAVISSIRRCRPRILFIPYWNDRHPDHCNASALARESVFYAGLKKLETGEEPFRPQHVIYYYHHEINEPVFVVDISNEFDTKLEAISAYRSQFFNPESGEPETYISSRGFYESIGARARHYGFMVGVTYGEPFYIKPPFKIDNLMTVFT